MGVAAGAMGVWIWWAFEAFSLIASLMSVNIMAAQTVCRNIGLFFYMVTQGLTQATSILLGNMIGAQNIKGAISYARVSFLLALIWGLISFGVMISFRE